VWENIRRPDWKFYRGQMEGIYEKYIAQSAGEMCGGGT